MTFERLYSLLFESNDNPIIGIVGVTNEEGTSFIVIRKGMAMSGHDDLIKRGSGNHAAALYAMKTTYDNRYNVAWRYAYSDETLYIWDLSQVDRDVLESTKMFLNKRGLEPKRIKTIHHDDESFDRSHF